MKLYHVTTPKKAQSYRQTGYIIKPVRGFTTLQAAMEEKTYANLENYYRMTKNTL